MGNNHFASAFTIKRTLRLAILLILVFYLLGAALVMVPLIGEHRLALRIGHLNEVSDDLISTVANLGFERGRTNVVLNDAGPPEGMADKRVFILERRTAL